MQDILRIQARVEDRDYRAEVKCPYCDVTTVVNPMMTESGCIHFEDYEELYGLHEDYKGKDRVEVIECKFRKNGSRCPKITKRVSGCLIETDDGFRIVADGKTEGFLTEEEFLDLLSGEKGI
ncbi:MAG: hypothetical protein M1162_00800 [Candidatus Thermoplasmatota archaeon]|nr:hypothetical protein [Candidatus Thermoplasmatota archaeon]